MNDPVANLREWLKDDECGCGFTRTCDGEGPWRHECADFDHMKDVEAVLKELEDLRALVGIER